MREEIIPQEPLLHKTSDRWGRILFVGSLIVTIVLADPIASLWRDHDLGCASKNNTIRENLGFFGKLSLHSHKRGDNYEDLSHRWKKRGFPEIAADWHKQAGIEYNDEQAVALHAKILRDSYDISCGTPPTPPPIMRQLQSFMLLFSLRTDHEPRDSSTRSVEIASSQRHTTK